MDNSKFSSDNQDPKDIDKILDKLSGILMTDEEILYISIQKKPALNISPDCIAVTTKRIVFCRPKNLGLSMEFQDYIWRDLKDCTLKENMLGSTLTIKTVTNQINEIDYLPKVQARKVYSICQEQEETQNEIRRLRELELLKAQAGNINVNQSPSPKNEEEKPTQEDPVETLKKLKDLLDNYLITRDEYDTKKQEILSRM